MKLNPSMMCVLLWTICLYRSGSSQTASERELGMAAINQGRRNMAKEYQIKNMNDLSWSTELETRAKKLSCDATHGSDYRVFLQPDPNDEVTVQVEEELLKYVTGEDLKQLIAANNLFIFEAFVPQQKYIACAPKQCMAQIPMPSGEIKQLVLSVLCVMGPHGSLGDMQIAIPDDAPAGNSEKKVAKSVKAVKISENSGTTGATNGWSNWNLHLIFTISLIVSYF